MSKTVLPPIAVSSLPPYLLKPLPKSRVRGHLQTMLMIQLRNDRYAVELAICENVWASRALNTISGWGKWDDRKCDDHSTARADFLKREVSMKARGYYSRVSTGLFLPLNETDVRHLRSEWMLPRSMLEYGHDLFESIETWATETAAATSATTLIATGPLAPSAGLISSAPGSVEAALSALGTAVSAATR